MVQAKDRDKLLAFLQSHGIEAKVHYPIPLHLQRCSAHLGYKAGDFPVAEAQAQSIITLPAHQHLKEAAYRLYDRKNSGILSVSAMQVKYLDLPRQFDDPELLRLVTGVFAHGQFVLGPEVAEFEAAIRPTLRHPVAGGG